MNELHDYTPVALYARVSSDRQDVDLSVAAQLRALRDHAAKNGYTVAREYVDEAESGRVANRPEFRRMIDEASKTQAPFREILVWKFSRFTRKREHAVAFKSMLRRKGIRVVSITEHADDSPTGKLMEAIIESVDEFYSENLATEVLRGMREAASRGFWVSSHAPFGYNRIMVPDGPKKRPTLEINPDTSRIIRRIFDLAEAAKGTQEITRILNNEGIASPRGKLWGKTSVHGILTNEAYTGTLVWGEGAKDKGEPVRVEKAFPAVVSKAQFRRVNQLMRSRAPKFSHPRRVGSSYLLSGLAKCQACNSPLTGRFAKSGQYAYYVCPTNIKVGKHACETPTLNARRFEELVVNRIRSNILTEDCIHDLVKAVESEMGGVTREQRKRLETIDTELTDVRQRLGRLYNLVETTDMEVDDFKPRIRELRERQDRLECSAEEARAALAQRRKVLDDVNAVAAYAREMKDFLEESELTERRAFIETFVKEILVVPGDALMRYTVPMPNDSLAPGKATDKVALPDAVLSTVQVGGPTRTELSLSQKSVRRLECKLWCNTGTGANRMPLRDMDREQMWLLPPSLDELLPQDHPARFVAEIVDALNKEDWSELGVDIEGDSMGAPAYHPRALLSVWLYGFMTGVRSCRKLEVACRDQIPYLWLTGWQHPDHNTLWRFYKGHRRSMRKLFERTVSTAVAMELVDLAVQAVDGTKVSSSASVNRSYDAAGLRGLLERLEGVIADLEAQNEAGEDAAVTRLPEELADKKVLREQVRLAMADLASQKRHSRINLTDPEARVMKGRHGGIVAGYNAQAMVSATKTEEGTSGMLVTAVDVVDEVNDNALLTPMMEQSEETTGTKSQMTLADAGYFAASHLAECDRRGQQVVVSEARQRFLKDPYHKDRFTYDEHSDSFRCPQGQTLAFVRIQHVNGVPLRLYRAAGAICQVCPALRACTKAKEIGRSLAIGPHDEVLRRHRAWMSTAAAKEAQRLRKQLVEPVFGIIKEQQGARRFLLRGLSNVTAEWTLLVTAFNLRTLWRVWSSSVHLQPST